MREIKRIAGLVGARTVVFPDTSDVLDTPQNGRHDMFPKGGATQPAVACPPETAYATLALGKWASRDRRRGRSRTSAVSRTRRSTCPSASPPPTASSQPLPRSPVPPCPSRSRTSAAACSTSMLDTQQYFHGRKVAIFGDPDHVIALTEFARDLGMEPVHVLTGTPGKDFEARDARDRARRQREGQGRPLPPPPVDQERAGRPAAGHHLRQVHRPCRGHPVRARGLPDPGPDRAQLLPDRGVPGRRCGSWRRCWTRCWIGWIAMRRSISSNS